jgi:nitric oxide dioxygenase
VKSLDRLEQVLPAVCALGARHAGYGVREKDYATVGRALIWALRKGLGDAFTPEVEAAWAEVYAALARLMKAAQAEAARPATVALAR